jgi:transcriptional regulator with XRE-family HTH domain
MFAPLDNKVIGESIAKLRIHKNKKARELASHLNIGEAAYTKYERGETAITISFINKIAHFFDIDPLEIIQSTPENIIENIHTANVIKQRTKFNGADNNLLDYIDLQLMIRDKQIEHLQLQIRNLLQDSTAQK